MSELRFIVRYDRGSDVLYISARQEAAAKGVEDRRGIVWRYDKDGNLIGVTIMDFGELWTGKHDELAGELSRRFHVPASDVEDALESA